MAMQRRAVLPCLLGFIALLTSPTHAYLVPTHGSIGSLDQSCLNQLNNIFNTYYLLTSTAASQDSRSSPWFLNSQRRLGCRLTILEALDSSTADSCPTEDQLINCFQAAYTSWTTFVDTCELFESQIPLPACSSGTGEAAEGVPACSDTNSVLTTTGRRRLLQGPANNAGITTSLFDFGEAAGLQYDPYAPAGSPYAQPPLAVSLAGSTGTDAAALVLAAEGSEGGTTSANGVIVSASGCFPSFWTGADFTAWLNGDLTETQRPKDIGGVNAVGLVSVFVYTLAMLSLALF